MLARNREIVKLLHHCIILDKNLHQIIVSKLANNVIYIVKEYNVLALNH